MLIILLLSLYLLLPRLISEEYVKSRIAGYVSEKTGFNIRLQNVDLIFFPRVHALIRDTSLSVPEKFAVKADFIRAYPEIFPLFRGDVTIKKIDLEALRLKIFIPENISEEMELFKETSFKDIEKNIELFFKHGFIRDTDLDVRIRSAEVGFHAGSRRAFILDGISVNLRLRPGRAKISLTGKSNICGKISAYCSFFPGSSAGEGNIELQRLNPGPLFDYFFPASALKINDSQINIRTGFNKEGFLKFSSKFEGEIPHLSFRRNDENLVITGRSFSGEMNADKEKTAVVLKKLDLVSPGLGIEGSFFASCSPSNVRFDLNGTNVDIDSVRAAALFLEGGAGTAKDIFDVIKGGKAPLINIGGKAQSLSELGNIENIYINGSILDGKISVPEPVLELEGVKGDVTVSGGILEGKNLEGRLGNSSAKQGVIKLGLSENIDIFRLNTLIHADLARLPSVLEQVVDDKTFLHELSLIKSCEGRAEGRLTVDDDGSTTHVKVDVSGFNFKANYKRFPYPISVRGEKFYLDDSMIYFRLADGAWGRSSVSNLSAGFRHDKENSFKISSEKAKISTKDINPFILSFECARNALKDVSFHQGAVNLNNLDISGPLFAPHEWSINTSGKIENLTIDHGDFYGKPFTVTGLTFKIPGKKQPKKGGGTEIEIEECRIASGKHNITFNGNAVLSKEKMRLDMNAAADFLEWSDIKEFTDNKIFHSGDSKKGSGDFVVSGIIRAKAKYLKFGDLTLNPVNADITLGGNNLSIAVTGADLCGVSLTGIIETARNKLDFRMLPFARDEKLESSINCFFKRRDVATGSFSLDGEIYTKGKGDEITGILYGTLYLKAKEGRIFQLGFLSKIFAILNLTEIFRGKIPDLVGEGFAYNSIAASGKLEKGNLVIKEFVIDGASMAIVLSGNIDLNRKSLDMVVLISPFKTVDLIIKYIPLVNRIFDGNIISIPFRVTGRMEDPEVIPLSPTAVGSGLLKMLQRTIELPIRIMQPLIGE